VLGKVLDEVLGEVLDKVVGEVVGEVVGRSSNPIYPIYHYHTKWLL